MPRPKKKSEAGRPSKIDSKKPILENDMVAKLIEAFKLDCTVEEACSYAKINKTTYYRHLEKNPEFSNEIEAARQYLKLLARQTVAKGINAGDESTAKWYLERKLKSEFAARTETTGAEGQPLNQEQTTALERIAKAMENANKNPLNNEGVN
jgi:hypothetical protein